MIRHHDICGVQCEVKKAQSRQDILSSGLLFVDMCIIKQIGRATLVYRYCAIVIFVDLYCVTPDSFISFLAGGRGGGGGRGKCPLLSIGGI